MKQSMVAAALAAFLFTPATSPAQPAQPAQTAQRPELFEALLRCRSVTDGAARLRCFDEAAANLANAAERREVVVVDRAQVRESQRRLFGLPLPRLPIFGADDSDAAEPEEIDSIESSVVSASQNNLGRWMLRLQDGSTWVQTDNQIVAMRPRAGHNVRVERGALGNFMMRISNQPAIRVRRQL